MRADVRQPIVVIDDSYEDVEITTVVLKGLGVDHPVVHLPDGGAARLYIQNSGDESKGAPRPVLILLDLNLPLVHGHDLLLEIRRADWLRTLPVLIMSSSNNPSDIERSYANGANSFFTKQVDFDKQRRMLAVICEYWLEYAATSLRCEVPKPVFVI
jgi:CheY-like chemotaxis protein